MEFGDHPLLAHVVDAVSAADGLRKVVVVTSHDDSDDPIAAWCETNNVYIWRGQLYDVAGRMLGAAEHCGAESFVRISGDSPMIDPRIISLAVQRFVMSSSDLVTNVRPRTFPAGQSVEVVRTQALECLLASKESRPEDHEHVTPILYRHESAIKIDRFTPSDMRSVEKSNLDGPYMSMTVDTPEDAERFHRVIRHAGTTNVWMRGWQQCEAMMRVADQQFHGALGDQHA